MERYLRHSMQVEVRVYQYDEKELDYYRRGLVSEPPKEIDIFRTDRFMDFKDSIFDVMDDIKMDADQAVEEFIDECPHANIEHLMSAYSPDEEDETMVECEDCGKAIDLSLE